MNKNVSSRSYQLLSRLYEEDKRFFTLSEAMEILSSSRPEAVRRLLSDMVKRGLILRLKNGLYNLIPYEVSSKEYFPNWHLTGEALAQPYKHYIGFYSALDIHGLITQPSMTEYIVTEKQILPKHQTINNIRFEFITLKPELLFGYKKTWIDDFNRVYCSDLEKTILDCVYMPFYGGGMTEIVKAIYKSTDNLNVEILHEYIKRFHVQAVSKRLGFILENMGAKFTGLLDELNREITSSSVLLDPSLPQKGKYNSRWKIIDNAGIETALKSIWT